MWALLLAGAAFAQNYSFPTSAADYGYFYPTAYYDHGGRDWACGGITYSGHRGNDFGVGSWAGMDAGRDVNAAADGTVVLTHDGEFDRCTTGTCGAANYVKIRHADGKETLYYHLKQWTVAVSVGQYVVCGQYLGLAGSSGNSTGPHEHFEVRSGGSGADPFDGPCSFPPSWWISQGGYNSLPGRTCNGIVDNCPNDPNKTQPGVCGCGVADVNSDGDGAYDCQESCPYDASKTSPGVCGCGVADNNSDGDGAYDCQESCPYDAGKTSPGFCGCGVADTNSDADSTVDCLETCDTDPAKLEPGVCGCGVADADSDGDAAYDCVEHCDADPAKTEPGDCGCGVADGDLDGDLALDCFETCDADPAKLEPGECGCGVPDEDLTGDGYADCTICGDGVVDFPEECDDAARAPGDGCDGYCMFEELRLDPPQPGVAGVSNRFSAHSVPPGDRALLLASLRLGATPVPGCPGLEVPLTRAVVLGTGAGDAQGDVDFQVNVPRRVRGLSAVTMVVDLDRCTMSELVLTSFQ